MNTFSPNLSSLCPTREVGIWACAKGGVLDVVFEMGVV